LEGTYTKWVISEEDDSRRLKKARDFQLWPHELFWQTEEHSKRLSKSNERFHLESSFCVYKILSSSSVHLHIPLSVSQRNTRLCIHNTTIQLKFQHFSNITLSLYLQTFRSSLLSPSSRFSNLKCTLHVLLYTKEESITLSQNIDSYLSQPDNLRCDKKNWLFAFGQLL
jgi:hypothetical protein